MVKIGFKTASNPDAISSQLLQKIQRACIANDANTESTLYEDIGHLYISKCEFRSKGGYYGNDSAASVFVSNLFFKIRDDKLEVHYKRGADPRYSRNPVTTVDEIETHAIPVGLLQETAFLFTNKRKWKKFLSEGKQPRLSCRLTAA